MGIAFSFRYAGEAKGHGYEQWLEEYCRRWISADIVPATTGRMESETKATSHGPITICVTHSMPVHMQVRPDENQRATESVYVMAAVDTRLHIDRRGGGFELAPGELALLSTVDNVRGTQSTRGTRISLRIPRPALGALTRRLGDKIGNKLEASAPLRFLTHRQIRLAHRLAPRLTPAENFAMAQHLFDLLALCVGADRDASHAAARRGLAAARLEAMKADILSLLCQSGLSIAAIARRHRVSERYIQQLFAQGGATFTDFVREQRLLLALRTLRNPAHHGRKIGDIALASGFSDLSYFNRSFRVRFGATPSVLRHIPMQ